MSRRENCDFISRTDSKVFKTAQWPRVQIVNVVDNEIRLLNTTKQPIHVPKNEQLCQVRATHIVDTKSMPVDYPRKTKPIIPAVSILPPFSKHVNTDPNNQLTPEWKVLNINIIG